MHVSHLTLRDFRSYEAADVQLQPGVTVFVGLNGQGKTNLVEAVHYLAQQRSHRVAKDAPLLRAGHDRAIVAARVRWADREQTVELELNAGRPNRARVGGAPRRPTEAIGVLRTVLFGPEDLALVRGDPGVRRRWCDELLVALTPRLAGVLGDYDRIVRQRSALLKTLAARGRDGASDLAGDGGLAIWDEQLIEVGAQVAAARLGLLESIAAPLTRAHQSVAPAEAGLRAVYESSWWPLAEPDARPGALRQALADHLARRRPAELARGITLVGPQRDDVALWLGELPAKGYASHGESWSIALAMRLAAFEVQRDTFTAGGDPVLILDDVFAELDLQRRERLAAAVRDAEQVLVTAAVPADVPSSLQGQRFTVTRGTTSEVSA